MTGNLRLGTGAAIAALYAIACFAKEHGIVLPAMLGAAELTVISDATAVAGTDTARAPVLSGAHARRREHARRSVVRARGPFARWVPAVHAVQHACTSAIGDRVLTALGVVPEWIRLLFWPAHLSSEYGPPEIEIAQGFSISQLPGLALLVAILGLGVVLRRRQPVISFGIAFACITLLPSSNFLLPAGIVLAERTLFLPSVGAMLIVGAVAVLLAERPARRDGRRASKARSWRASSAAALIAAAMARSIQRTTVWRDNDRLFRQAVLDSPLDYRAHFMLGAWDFEQKRKREGEAEYRKSARSVSVRSVPVLRHGGAVSRGWDVRAGDSAVSVDATASIRSFHWAAARSPGAS